MVEWHLPEKTASTPLDPLTDRMGSIIEDRMRRENLRGRLSYKTLSCLALTSSSCKNCHGAVTGAFKISKSSVASDFG